MKQNSTSQQLWFTAPQQVEIREQVLPSLESGEVLVETQFSAISAGTEMLVYRGQIPSDMALDANLDSLQNNPSFPLQYGYACVGQVQQLADDVDSDWLGKCVFAFQPHASHFISSMAHLIPLPDDISPEAALFLANMETAVSLVQDGNPGLGERVVVLGQGIVGLLLSNVLNQFPLAQLNIVDAIPARRTQALDIGVKQAFDPFSETDVANLKQQLLPGADLIYEISGVPDALNLAIALSGFSSRIVIGSWYGTKTAAIALGGNAHRNRLKITTSQVSNIAPDLTGRWDKTRRFELAWEMIRKLHPEQFISHRFALTDAAKLYQQLDKAPENILQAIFTYSDSTI